MFGTVSSLALLFLFFGNTAGDVTLVSFNPDDGPLPIWREMNDPVMGGKSTGDFLVEEGMGVFRGEVVDVPFLKAPGFIQASSPGPFEDSSGCKALAVTCRSVVPYDGYKISFSNKRGRRGCGFFSRGFKAPLDAPTGDEFQTVVIPFEEFSDCNDDATGLPIRTCSEDPDVCPDTKTLENMRIITVWGEAVAGKVHLEIKKIEATDCSRDDIAGDE